MGGVVKGVSSILSMATMFIDKESESGQKATGAITAASGALNIVGGFMSGGVVGGLMSVATSLPMIISGITQWTKQETRAEKLEKLHEEAAKQAEESSRKASESKSKAKNLRSSVD
jgi:hypothetical protein